MTVIAIGRAAARWAVSDMALAPVATPSCEVAVIVRGGDDRGTAGPCDSDHFLEASLIPRLATVIAAGQIHYAPIGVVRQQRGPMSGPR